MTIPIATDTPALTNAATPVEASEPARESFSAPLQREFPQKEPLVDGVLHLGPASLAPRVAINSPPANVLTGRQLLDIDVPKPVAIVDGLFLESKDSIMGGAYGIGKTTASLHIAVGIAAGDTVFGLHVTRPYRV